MDPIGSTIGGLALLLSGYNSWQGRHRLNVSLTLHMKGGGWTEDGRARIEAVFLIVELATNRDMLVQDVKLESTDGRPLEGWSYPEATLNVAPEITDGRLVDFGALTGTRRTVAAHTSSRWVLQPKEAVSALEGRSLRALVTIDGRRRPLASEPRTIGFGNADLNDVAP